MIAVVAYWVAQIPALSHWHGLLEGILHAAMFTLAVQLLIYLGKLARPIPTIVGRAIMLFGGKIGRGLHWLGERVEINGNMSVRIGRARPPSEPTGA